VILQVYASEGSNASQFAESARRWCRRFPRRAQRANTARQIFTLTRSEWRFLSRRQSRQLIGNANFIKAGSHRRRLDRAHGDTIVGADWPSAAGFAPGDRRARARDREGTQGTMYTTEQEYPDRPRGLGERAAHVPRSALVPERNGGRLSAHGVHHVLAKHVVAATSTCPSLKHKRVSPHVLRHYLPHPTMSSSRMMSHDSKGL
jgi:hypothetical protein